MLTSGKAKCNLVALVIDIFHKPQVYWKTKENVINSAKECQTITEWGNRDRGALYSAKENDWFDEAISHMKATIKPNGYWNNKERVLLSAKKFDAITAWTRAHWLY
jgi:hypothetical protein